MGDKNSFHQLQDFIRQFCDARDWERFHGPKDLAIGLVTESSELLEHFRFMTAEQCQSLVQAEESRRELGKELADILFFLLRFADRFDFDLAAEFWQKMESNAKRYPVGEFRGRNHKAKHEED